MKNLLRCLLLFSLAFIVLSCASNLLTKKNASSIDLYVMPISGFTRFYIDSTNIKSVCTVNKKINRNNEFLSDIEEWMASAKTSSIDSFGYNHIRAMVILNRGKNTTTSMQVDVGGNILWKNKVYVLDRKGLFLILELLSEEQRNDILRKMPMHQW